MPTKKPKTGLFSRSSRLLGMAAKVASHEVRNTVRKRLSRSEIKRTRSEFETRVAQAVLVTKNLSKLKGAAMKVGQLLSMDASDLLPEEASRVLATLQGNAEPVDFGVMQTVLNEELADDRLGRLEQLQAEPAASASIGQVHRAVVSGQSVAVKIQYPGIAESIDSDLQLLETLADSWRGLSRSKIDVSETLDEMRQVLHYEADYRREAQHTAQFRELLSDDARFVVPKIFPELCSRRVLTMSWQEGMALKEWIGKKPSIDRRLAFARALLDLYCREFFEWGLVQTDPNPGNFLMTDDDRIVLLDFGATLHFDDDFRVGYVKLLRAVAAADRAAMVAEGVAFEIIDAREPAEAKELFADMLLSAMAPFEARHQPFNFQDDEYAERSKEVVTRFIKSLKYSPPPRKLIFLHRKLGGLFQLLKRLGVAMDLSPYWQRMVEERPAQAREAVGLQDHLRGEQASLPRRAHRRQPYDHAAADAPLAAAAAAMHASPEHA